MRVLEISVNATSCNAVTVPPHDVIQKKMTPWVQLTAEGTWPHDRCVWGGSGYCGEKPPHTVISHVRLPGWGCKRRKETIGFFFFFSVLQVTIQPSSPSFVPYSQFDSRLRLLQFIFMKNTKKTSQTENAEQIIFNRARDEFSCSSV